MLAPDTSVIPDENRTRADFPDVAAAAPSLPRLSRRFEAWFEDHMGLRYHLVKGHHFLKFFLLREAPTDNLLVGRDGWLFLARDFGLASYRALEPLSPVALDRWEALFTDAERWLAARDITFLVVIAPNKSSIYEDKLPAGVARAGPHTRTDQLVARLRRGPVDVLDLRDTLRAARRRVQVYHKRDTHWNGHGALAAYRAVTARLARGVVELSALPEPEVAQRVEVRAGDLSKMIPLGRLLREEQIAVAPLAARSVRREPPPEIARLTRSERKNQVFEIPGGGGPRAVIFRDSFATALIPLLSEHFERSVWRWERAIDPVLIETERPDVVVFEMVERYLMDAVPENRLAPGAVDVIADKRVL